MPTVTYAELTAHLIGVHGAAVQPVGYDCMVPGCRCEPSRHPWTYTIGLVERLHPEVVAIGLPLRESVGALRDLAHELVDGHRRPPEEPWVREGRWLRLDPLPHRWLSYDHARMAFWFNYYGRTVAPPRVLQLVWSDASGRFPDEAGCDPLVVADQPLLARDPLAVPPRLARTRRRHARTARRAWS
jgi:hypothetical protein